MKLTILGASGAVGTCLVTEALARGHEVTAVTRPSGRYAPPPGVRALAGDLTDTAFLRTAVRGADAVLSALGLRMPGIAPWHRPEDPTFLSRAYPAILAAMHAEGVRRIAIVSAGGAGDSRKAMPAVFRAMMATSALRHAYAELDRIEPMLLSSGLDVCIARPGGLSNGPATHRVEVVSTIGSAQIARADVAGWMLDQLATTPFAHRVALIAAV